MKFKDKIVLITGGSSGIGAGIVDKFLKEGAKVIVFDINQPNCDVEYFKVDISNESEVKSALAQISHLDVLVNNAGIYAQDDIESMGGELVSKMIDINIKGTIWVTKYALPLIKLSKGNIVNISSCLGLITEPGSSIYSATKAAIIMLTKSWAMEYAKDQVRVNTVLPGPMETPLLRAFLPTDEQVKAHGAKKPFGRVGVPEDVANMVAFIASDEASYSTGGIYTVDGGESASSLYTPK
jgi:NAD(P)-dependent dehydrogenase (short-subunit alcohol dehydrogenase family)